MFKQTDGALLDQREVGQGGDKEAATAMLKRQYNAFQDLVKVTVKDRLQLVLRRSRKYGNMTLKEVFDEFGDQMYEGSQAAPGYGNEADHLATLGNLDNGLVGRTLTVNEILEILNEE